MVNHDILHQNRVRPVSAIPLEEYLKIFLCVLEIANFPDQPDHAH
jgi:hypothetical protein